MKFKKGQKVWINIHKGFLTWRTATIKRINKIGDRYSYDVMIHIQKDNKKDITKFVDKKDVK